MRDFLSGRVLAVSLVVGMSAGGVGYAVANGGGESQPQEASSSAQTPASGAASDGCVLTEQLAHGVELGALTEEQACQMVEAGEQEDQARQGPQNFPDGPSLAIEGKVQEDMVADCRAGTSDHGGTAEVTDLYCTAILKIAAGELKPTRICDPPECSEPGTPLWEYSETRLRELAGVDR